MTALKPPRRTWSRAVHAIVLAAALAGAAQAQSRREEPVSLNFVNADIEAVARTLATISGRSVVVDPRVKGTITLATERPVAPAQALRQFGTALQLQGFALIDSDGLYKIVPDADAKLQSGTVNAGATSALPVANQVVTQIFTLNHENANNLVPILRPLISPNNTINVNPGTNALVITDFADNLRRLGRIIAALDVANATDVEVVPLRHAVAADLVPLLQRLIESGSGGTAGAPIQGQTDSGVRNTLLAEPRSNSLVMRAANPARLALVRALVTKLDQPSSQSAAGDIHVVYLKNADAVSLATTLRAALSGGGGAAGGGSGHSAPAHRWCWQRQRRPPSAPPRWRERSAFHRRSDPGRPSHQRLDHHRARAAIPPAARRD
jgi:general secretion pathway protein D